MDMNLRTCPELPKQLSTIFILRAFASLFTENKSNTFTIILLFNLSNRRDMKPPSSQQLRAPDICTNLQYLMLSTIIHDTHSIEGKEHRHK